MFHIDDYGATEIDFIIDATPVDPCHLHGEQKYLVHLLLYAGRQSYERVRAYPTRAMRDAAYEAISGMIQRAQHELEAELEEGEEL